MCSTSHLQCSLTGVAAGFYTLQATHIHCYGSVLSINIQFLTLVDETLKSQQNIKGDRTLWFYELAWPFTGTCQCLSIHNNPLQLVQIIHCYRSRFPWPMYCFGVESVCYTLTLHLLHSELWCLYSDRWSETRAMSKMEKLYKRKVIINCSHIFVVGQLGVPIH